MSHLSDLQRQGAAFRRSTLRPASPRRHRRRQERSRPADDQLPQEGFLVRRLRQAAQPARPRAFRRHHGHEVNKTPASFQSPVFFYSVSKF